MSEREFEIEPYGVAYDCDECGEEMTPTRDVAVWLTQPVPFLYECPNGHRAALTGSYPEVRWRNKTCCKGGPQWGHAWDCPGLPG